MQDLTRMMLATKTSFLVLGLALRLFVCAAEPLWKDVCTQNTTIDLPFCNTTLDISHRIDDLLLRIPVRSQIPMMGNDAAGYEELHIPPYQWWSEGLHGNMQNMCFSDENRTACATSFPCPSTLASSFNDTLFFRISSAIGREVRAVSNVRSHDGTIGDGLTFWSPVVNMQRDPRWGRNQEVPGEDPLLTSRFAIQYVKGLQQKGFTEATSNQPMQLAACCKHFLANSLELWMNHSRHDFNAVVSPEDLQDYYLPPFSACVKEAGVAGIMCSYNAVNGIPSCVNEPILKDILRDGWGFNGYITSDCGALNDIAVYHHYTDSHVQTVALAANASTNLNCGRLYADTLPLALQQGFVTAETVSNNLRTLLTVQMKLGLYDQPKNKSPYATLGIDDIDSVEHQELALEAAAQSVVLLQNNIDATNKKPCLPFLRNQRIAVVGPHSNSTTAFLSNYFGRRCPSGNDADCMITPVAAIAQANANGTTVSAMGCEIDGPKENIAQAQEIAASADAIVVMVGLDRSQEAEGLDRLHTILPGHQVRLVETILEIDNPRTVVVLVNGGSMSLGPKILSKAPAIVAAGYGGQSATQALSNVLFGDYNPSGRLAATMYPPEFVHNVPLTDMSLRNGMGRTHMFYQGKPEFSFGHGLSFSSWSVQYEYSYDPGARNGKLSLLATLTNLGPLPGRQSLLLLLVPKESKAHEMRQRLINYAGTAEILGVGEKGTVEFELDHILFEDNDSMELVVLEPNGVRKKLGTCKDLIGNAFSTNTMLRKESKR